MFQTRPVTSLAGAALSALILLTQPGGNPVFAETAPLVKVRISKVPIANYVPVDLALSRGWFKDEGLDVRIEGVMVGTLALGALVADKLEVVYETLMVGLKARAQGFDVVFISGNNNAALKPPHATAILTRNELGIRTLKDLEGQRLAILTLQNINSAYTREAVARAGGDPNKVHFLEVGFPLMIDSLLGGQMDAAYVVEPFLTIGLSTGKLSVLSYPQHEVQPGLNIAGWIARGNWVKEHPRAAARFRAVIQKAMDFLDRNPREKTAAMLKFTTLEPALLAKIALDDWTTKIDAADLQKQLDLYVRHGMIDKRFDVTSMIVP